MSQIHCYHTRCVDLLYSQFYRAILVQFSTEVQSHGTAFLIHFAATPKFWIPFTGPQEFFHPTCALFIMLLLYFFSFVWFFISMSIECIVSGPPDSWHCRLVWGMWNDTSLAGKEPELCGRWTGTNQIYLGSPLCIAPGQETSWSLHVSFWEKASDCCWRLCTKQQFGVFGHLRLSGRDGRNTV